MTKVMYGLMGGFTGLCALAISEAAMADNCCQSGWSALATLNNGAKACTQTVGGGTCNAEVEYAGVNPCGFCRTRAELTNTSGAYSPAYQIRCRTSSTGSWTYSAWTADQIIVFECDAVTTTQEQCRTQLADATYCSSTCDP
jgi:hypothetical protein